MLRVAFSWAGRLIRSAAPSALLRNFPRSALRVQGLFCGDLRPPVGVAEPTGQARRGLHATIPWCTAGEGDDASHRRSDSGDPAARTHVQRHSELQVGCHAMFPFLSRECLGSTREACSQTNNTTTSAEVWNLGGGHTRDGSDVNHRLVDTRMCRVGADQVCTLHAIVFTSSESTGGTPPAALSPLPSRGPSNEGVLEHLTLMPDANHRTSLSGATPAS